MAKFRFRFPSAITVITLVAFLAAVATWIIPAGEYDRLSYSRDAFTMDNGDSTVALPATQRTLDSLGIPSRLEKFQSGDIRKPVAIPGTYRPLPRNPQGVVSLIEAPVKGLYETVDIIFFVLVIGGFISVFYASGVLDLGIRSLVHRMRGRENHLVLIFSFLFAAGGSSYGMAEEAFAFYPILIPVFLAAGYDLLMPVAVLFLAPQIGTLASVSNPFSVIMASNVAGVNWTSGLGARVILFFLSVGITLVYLIRYGNRVRKNPLHSLVYRLEGRLPGSGPEDAPDSDTKQLDLRGRLVLGLFLLTFVTMVFGVVYLGWWLLEMTAVFLGSGILMAFITRMPEGTFVEKFLLGARDLVGVAFIIGLARGVTLILNEGRISDSILYYAAGWVQHMPGGLFVAAVLIVFLFLTLFIASSSGMAVLTMPIMGALAAMHGIDGSHMVDAYLLGMGVTGIITPTGLALPSLAMVNVSYKTWIRFMLPLMGILLALSFLFLIITVR